MGALTLPPTAQSARAARRFVVGLLGDSDRDLVDAAALLVSEVVTNAVMHTHTDLEVTATITADELHVAVRDGSSLLPAQRDYDAEAATGRGLGLVEALASAYGVDILPGEGKVVWFRVGGAAGESSVPDWPLAQENAAGGERPPAGDVTRVDLLGLPVSLYQVMQEHNDALLREHALLRLSDAGTLDVTSALGGDIAAAERAHGRLAAAVGACLAEAGEAGTLDVRLTLSAADAEDFQCLERTLADADRLAAQGRLLTRLALPELQALRAWCCAQVEMQMSGTGEQPWGHAGTAGGSGGADRHGNVAGAGVPVPDYDVRTVLDAGTPMIAADDDDRVIAVNVCAARLLGWEPGQLTGQRLLAIIPPRLREAHVAAFTRHLLTGQARLLGRPVVLPALARDGREVEVEVTVTSVRAPRGRRVFLASLAAPSRQHLPRSG